MSILDSIVYVIILILSVALHEVAHGYAALREGDDTALKAGRLTLNPLAHFDLFGSVLLPLVLIFSSTGIVFGWAKPVPYREDKLRNPRTGTIIVASAGIIVNLALALIFSLIVRLSVVLAAGPALISVFASIVLINIVLAVFNLVPIPPLDGSKILFSLLPSRYRDFEYTLSRYSFVFVIIFIFFLWKFISPIIGVLFSTFTGLS